MTAGFTFLSRETENTNRKQKIVNRKHKQETEDRKQVRVLSSKLSSNMSCW